MARPIHEIAQEVQKDWKKVYFGAVPYLEAMLELDSVSDKYGQDSAPSIIRYFLSNATSWRGPVAKGVKAELNAMIKGKYASVVERVATRFLAGRGRDDKLIEEHFRSKLDHQTLKLIGQANFDLYTGPSGNDEDYPGWETAIRTISHELRNELSEVWVDLQAGYVMEDEPQGMEDEESGEWVEPEWSDYRHYDIRDVKRALLGELAQYIH